MGNFLWLLLSLSVSGGVLVLFAALLNRLLRGKMPRSFLCGLWLLVLARFLLPVGTSWSVTNRLLGAFQETQTQAAPPAGLSAPSQPIGEAYHPSVEPAEDYIPAASGQDEPSPPVPVRTMPSAASVLTAAWGLGALALLCWRLYSYHRLTRVLTEGERPVEDWERELYSGVAGAGRACPALRRSEAIRSPVLAGVLRPVVWIPADSLNAVELSYALRHELTHWRRRDLYRKWAAALTACLHWFNPAVWYLLRALDRDCELACDEAVVKELSLQDRRVYGELLLRCASGKAPTGAICTSFNTQKQIMKERLTVVMKKISDGKKPRALFAAAAAAVILMGTALGAYAAWGGAETGGDPVPGATEPGAPAPGETGTAENAAPEETGTAGNAASTVDLNRNGVPETIDVVWQDDEMRYQLTVTEGDKVIFTQNAYTSHAGWNALFLYKKDGQDFLLRYTPMMYQGDAAYGYQLFYLAEGGSEVTVQENWVYFDVNFGGIHRSFAPEEIAAFLTEVNALLSGSVQLMNTDLDLIEAFELEGGLYHVPTFLRWRADSSYYDENKTMLENLTAYKAEMEEMWEMFT